MVARILGAKGLAGVMRIEPLTDWREHLEVGATVFLEGEAEPRRIRTAEWGGRVPAVGLEGVASREEAQSRTCSGRQNRERAIGPNSGFCRWRTPPSCRVT